ncbi:MAG: hypothetical protein R2755_27310 [Acidimicrobiales bacterium]
MDDVGAHRRSAAGRSRCAGRPRRHHHWIAYDQLAALGAHPTSERTVIRGKVATAAGVSAGIDLALTLVQRWSGDFVAQAIQLGIEYDPQPPLDAGLAGQGAGQGARGGGRRHAPPKPPPSPDPRRYAPGARPGMG